MSRKSVRTSETDPILVDFLPDDQTGTRGRLGMTFAPGMRAPSLGGDWERHLVTDLKSLEEEHGIGVLVSLMEEHEYRGYGIPQLYERDQFHGIGVRRFAIRDMGIPKEAESREFEAMVREVIENLERGRNVAVHCRGGLGRTGTVAACILVALGRHTAEEAIGAVRAARKGAVQTREQEDFVCRLEESLGEEAVS
ncbi:MAG: cyclin-dependent kinase inhibitor 3 family protein [Actinomycetota bacterium]|nr:cyclin-dependent kinase inhibitor 3 family protein [Actinomycetota bacterium]